MRIKFFSQIVLLPETGINNGAIHRMKQTIHLVSIAENPTNCNPHFITDYTFVTFYPNKMFLNHESFPNIFTILLTIY